ncbi:putative bifunctional diguanylate cyclase/phosphodiesterase [Marinobacterium sp. YM272]|uniref:putative bifunctional diguanylate cyclase/phosphodiesterase n=1 Tax=Marinobacterium sp. YM272 TaxID=3421654 RepID=UPI003D7F31D6
MAKRRRSLKRKLTIVLVLVSSTVLALATLGFAANDWFSLRGNILDRLSAQADVIGASSASALLFDDEQAATRTLATLQVEEEIIASMLFDENKELFASYTRNGLAMDLALPPGGEGRYQGYFYVNRPVTFDAERLGQVVLLLEPKRFEKLQLERLSLVAILFMTSLLVAVGLSNLTQRLITAPVLQLAVTARRITETRNYKLRAMCGSRDEIGELADDFNAMLREIERRDQELQQAQSELEAKVSERTDELLELTRQFEHQAFHDALTGLPNRMTFDRDLEKSISIARRAGHQLAVMFLDLDRFKAVNDTLGHAIGDRLLITLAKRLKGQLRASDTLARLGGDEFALLLIETSPDAAVEVAGKLIRVINQPVEIDSYSLRVTTSIGISIYPDDSTDAGTLLKNADTAMYFSKDVGRNRFSFYSREMNSRSERRMQLENMLRAAIAEQQLQVYYQPKYSAQTRQLVGVEALVRWYDPEEGFISPEEFIPLAEECGLIGEIDDWVTLRACRDLMTLAERDLPAITLAVNFSPAHFVHRGLSDRIEFALKSTGFPGSRLEIEVTEAVVASEAEHLHEYLNKIRDLGVSLAIDDFGIAYSSLSRLKQLPINTLKIDRSFIQDIGNDSDDEVIVRTIIDMAHNLNLKVIAEGVETEAQFEFVRLHGCDQIQGFLFGKPMPLDELATRLESASGSCVSLAE